MRESAIVARRGHDASGRRGEGLSIGGKRIAEMTQDDLISALTAPDLTVAQRIAIDARFDELEAQ